MRNADFSKKIYQGLIDGSRQRILQNEHVDHEMHHILPKCMGGKDHVDNMVWLTKYEHMMAHYLLWRIHRDKRNAASFYLTLTADSHRGSGGYAVKDYHKKACRRALKKTNTVYILNNTSKMIKIYTTKEIHELVNSSIKSIKETL